MEMKNIITIPGDKLHSPITFGEYDSDSFYIIEQGGDIIEMNMRQLDSLGAAIERYCKFKLEEIKNAN
jgi:hypothetical protein